MENQSNQIETTGSQEIPQELMQCIQGTLDMNFIDADTYLGEHKQEAINLFNQLKEISIEGVSQVSLFSSRFNNTEMSIDNLMVICRELTQIPSNNEEQEVVTPSIEMGENNLDDLIMPYFEEAENKVNSFIEQGNIIDDKDKAIKDYAILANKDTILANYRAEIEKGQSNDPEVDNAQITQYTEEWYRVLEESIRSIETRVQNESPIFYNYILEQSDSIIPTRLEEWDLDDTKRETITAILSGNDSRDSFLESDWTLVVGDQRIRVGQNGEIESQIFVNSERGEVSIDTDMPSMDNVIRENILLSQISKDIDSLTHHIKTKKEKIILLKEELEDVDPESDIRRQIEERIASLEAKILELEATIKELEDNKEDQARKVKQEQRAYRRVIEQNNRRVRETADYLTSIGIDQFPGTLFQEIIQRINNSPALRLKLGIHNDIDLWKGDLGFNFDFWSKEISMQEKRAFAEIINQIITGKKEEPINIEAVWNVMSSPIEDRGSFSLALVESGITGMSGISGVIARLEKDEEETLDLNLNEILLDDLSPEFPTVSIDSIVYRIGSLHILKKASSQTLSVYQGEKNILYNIKDTKNNSLKDYIDSLVKKKGSRYNFDKKDFIGF